MMAPATKVRAVYMAVVIAVFALIVWSVAVRDVALLLALVVAQGAVMLYGWIAVHPRLRTHQR